LLCGTQVVIPEIVVAGGGGERGPDLRIGQPAGQSSVATVPQFAGKLAPRLLHDEFDQRARVEENERHDLTAAGR
jgi:hypothetical protein